MVVREGGVNIDELKMLHLPDSQHYFYENELIQQR
jgi:hypothetical protein